MSSFIQQLREHRPKEGGRRWIYVPYDQLTDAVGPLAETPPDELGIVMIESAWKAARRPYHRQKLALVLANMRRFALEQARRGVAVRYLASERPYAEVLAPLAEELGCLTLMEPAERELRVHLSALVDAGALELVPHGGWLTSEDQFERGAGSPPWRMDAFYRLVRRESGFLMEDGKPVGGKFSFDADNRKPWRGEPPAPEPLRFEVDEITEEVGDLIRDRFADHPGTLDLASLPSTKADAERLWRWALDECMESFGPYEDAMSTRSRGLFHTRVSQLLNLGRLLPERLVREAAAADAPLSSREGFVRQILGWREFVRHVHRATDGFRAVPDTDVPVAEQPGDGGWSGWSGADWPAAEPDGAVDGGACPSHLGADNRLPPAFWGAPSGLACLDTVVDDVWETGYGHHITRLMVLGNLATLLDVEPRQVTDWFWAAYTDAYDWVVEPNVLGMATFGTGAVMTTKPYVAGSNYINRMSDYCEGCRFDPKKNCPITPLYWAFLSRHQEELDGNPRMNLVMGSLRKRAPERRDLDQRTFEVVRDRLADGGELTPDDLA